MSAYKFKTHIRISGGKSSVQTVEKFSFSRAEIKTHLEKLIRQGELNDGEEKLKALLAEALSKPGWRKITITKNS
jgi:hypothetical protein